MHSPYGATEALPVCSIVSDDVPGRSVAGACVGRPVAGMEVRIIPIAHSPIVTFAETRALPCGEIGEIIVRGPTVTKCYDALPEATAVAKIRDGDTIYHRLGDCGYLDTEGRLWFVGRKAECVETTAGPLFTEPCEQVFRQNDCVVRCALIGLGPRGSQTPALVVQIWEMLDPTEKPAIAHDLRQLALQHPHTAGITKFFFHPSLPVDVRHNAKIHRLTLAQWATTAKAVSIQTESTTDHTDEHG
jgi:acyl-CoA synthetase (AMP-forming)/AMP-acid ligase II